MPLHSGESQQPMAVNSPHEARPPRSRRAVAAALSIVLVVLIGGYTAYWRYAEDKLETGLEAWTEARRAEGYDVKWDTATVGGFPFAFRIVLDHAAFARGNPATYQIATPQIAAEARPWNLYAWHLSAPQGASATAQAYPEVVTAASLSGDVLIGTATDRIDLAARDASAGGASLGEIDAGLTVPRQAPQSHTDLGLAAVVQLRHLTLPHPVLPLGDTVESVTLDGRVMGGLQPGDLLQALKAWRDDGGTVEIAQAELHWGALALETSGTMALDEDMQPLGAMRASIVDHDALIDACVAAGLLQPKAAPLVKLVLDVLAKPGPDGHKRLTAPVTVQAQKVLIGDLEIAQIPRVEWK
jgi:hypothetical protein